MCFLTAAFISNKYIVTKRLNKNKPLLQASLWWAPNPVYGLLAWPTATMLVGNKLIIISIRLIRSMESITCSKYESQRDDWQLAWPTIWFTFLESILLIKKDSRVGFCSAEVHSTQSASHICFLFSNFTICCCKHAWYHYRCWYQYRYYCL